jgi:hypothetical protein
LLLLVPADPAERASTATAPVSAVSERAAPPDIVLIVTDDQRWDTLWAMPILSERLAGAGVTLRYSTGEEELYDLVADPFELENVAGVPGMRSVLEDRRARLRELCTRCRRGSWTNRDERPDRAGGAGRARARGAGRARAGRVGDVAENAPTSVGPWIG